MNTSDKPARPPLLIQILQAHPDVQVKALTPRPGVSVYHIDFGRTLYLADSDDVLFLQLANRITSIESAGELLEFLSLYAPNDQLKLVSVPGIARGVPLQRMAAVHPNLALVTSTKFDREVRNRGFEHAVASALRGSIGQERLVLYQYRGAVTGNRFFGREHQVQALMREPRTSYLVTGARMSGKTSLLLEAKRQLRNYQRNARALETTSGIAYLDCREVSTVGGFFHAILLQLEERSSFARPDRWESPERWPQFFRYLRARAKLAPHRRLYLFLDEFDNVIDIEHRSKLNLTWRFRALHQSNSQENGFIQFVLAGSKHLAAAQKNLSTGLHNFVNTEDCRLDNFDLGTVRTILERPLHDVGMEVEDPQTAATVLISETGGRPASVQYVCRHIVQRMIKNGVNVLTVSMLAEVVASRQYLDFYEATLRENTDITDRFVLAAGHRIMDRKGSFTLEEVLAEARRVGVVVNEARIYESLADLDNAGFIRPMNDRARAPYIIAAPVLRKAVQRRPLEKIAKELADVPQASTRG